MLCEIFPQQTIGSWTEYAHSHAKSSACFIQLLKLCMSKNWFLEIHRLKTSPSADENAETYQMFTKWSQTIFRTIQFFLYFSENFQIIVEKAT